MFENNFHEFFCFAQGPNSSLSVALFHSDNTVHVAIGANVNEYNVGHI